jgi:hypothetical protein
MQRSPRMRAKEGKARKGSILGAVAKPSAEKGTDDGSMWDKMHPERGRHKKRAIENSFRKAFIH